ncbi:fused response regulator/phosphatase [Candidatus Reidiella endopervernicosa]|uniref:ATP-binding SpoIIE family protein phosphatase n=1 Tax=Candidatus Reidiella endopervernicosa TaxID=2738883 RepID=UPI002A4E190C|nr:fused response regulator/phosphatase [Candidatus Reidiella endopervernicosa]
MLIVDDDQTNRLVLEAILKKYGFQILAADDGSSAVTLFKQQQPDLVLMDVMMPIMDGYEATRQIKAISVDRFVPIIFLTALNDEKALAECVSCGGDDFLTKPYNHVILKAKIDALMRMRELYIEVKAQKDELSYHHERLRREHEIAERVFANVIKPTAFSVPNIKHMLSPMAMANGDMLLVGQKPSSDYHYLLGDFTGHGLSAAIGALPVSDIFYTMTRKGFHISDIAAEINRKLKLILPTGMFFAACLVEFDHKKGAVSIWNGGIPDLLLCDEKGITRKVAAQHLPLGVLNDGQFDRAMDRFEVVGENRIYIYSDGIIESTNEAGEMFGQQRFDAAFTSTRDPSSWFETIQASLEQFRGSAPQSDDLTLLEIHCNAVENALAGTKQPAVVHATAEASEWGFVVELGASALRMLDPKPMLTQMLVDIQGLEEHRERLYMVLTELYANALEHGLLKLDSALKRTENGFIEYYTKREAALLSLEEGWIKIDISHQPDETGGRLTIRLEDSGDGFSVDDAPAALEGNLALCGRGVELVRSLCETVTYHGNGNCVEAIYKWEG